VSIWRKFQQEFSYAFALTASGSGFTPEEIILLEKIAGLVVKRGVSAPVLLFLESLGPLNFLGSQIVHGLKPFLEIVSDATEIERLATILERRGSVDRLISLIQERVTSLA
jgi:hypothetical protein